MGNEVWRHVVGFKGLYEVSDLGRIKSVSRMVRSPNGGQKAIGERIMKCRLNNNGYPRCNISKRGVVVTVLVHIVVARSFHGKCPRGHEVRHKDGDQANCREANLCYGTKLQNESDKVAHGTAPRGEKCGTAKLSRKQVAEIRLRYSAGGVTQRELGAEYGVSHAAIGLAVSGKSWAWLTTEGK